MLIPVTLYSEIVYQYLMNGRYKCSVCGKVYDPALGDPYENMRPGTEFSALPPAWCCPVCRAAKEKFQPEE
jgi:rubredoxin